MICPYCNTENDAGVKFCGNCGSSLAMGTSASSNADTEVMAESFDYEANSQMYPQTPDREFSGAPEGIGARAENTESKITHFFNKIGKKWIIIASIILVVVIAVTVLALKFVLPYAPHYFKANSALESGNYYIAIEEYKSAGNFLDSKSKLNNAYYLYAEDLYGKGNFYDAATYYNMAQGYDGLEDKLFACGEGLIQEESYEYAVEVLEMTDGGESAMARDYAQGMMKFTKEQYKQAKTNFESAGGYRDSSAMLNSCDIMIAEEYCKNGKFNEAKKIYALLPENFEYNGISVSKRIKLLKDSEKLQSVLGAPTWTVTECYRESKKTEQSGRSHWWYNENVLNHNIEVQGWINNNDKFDIEITVTFDYFDEYISESTEPTSKKYERTFIIRDITEIPSYYSIDDNTTLYYSGDEFRIEYYDWEEDYYNTYSYTSNVTFRCNEPA